MKWFFRCAMATLWVAVFVVLPAWTTLFVMRTVHAQTTTNIVVPDYGQVLIRATPTLDVLATMDAIMSDLDGARYRMKLAYDHAYRAQYTEANLFAASGLALIEAIPVRYAEPLARLSSYVNGNSRHALGWNARAFSDTVLSEVATLRAVAERLKTTIDGLTGDFPADRAALDALL